MEKCNHVIGASDNSGLCLKCGIKVCEIINPSQVEQPTEGIKSFDKWTKKEYPEFWNEFEYLSKEVIISIIEEYANQFKTNK